MGLPERPAGPSMGDTPVIRTAHADDMEQVAAIYAHYVVNSVATFELDPPAAGAWRERLDDLGDRRLPFLVADAAGGVAGYAFLAPWKPRPAYRHTAEDSIYLAPGHQG